MLLNRIGLASICYRSTRRSNHTLRELLQIKPEVVKALQSCEPVAALESTIVAHGMPYPQNLEVALEVEDILRSKGVTPATIAVHNSKCLVGLTSSQIKDLALSGSQPNQCLKLTTRDLPLFLASSTSSSSAKWGATTVASTMYLSHLAGIHTFITGGTGGVHRGVESTMDISADLIELSRTPVIVISAGIKSILDIPKTLEVLETNSVPVTVWGSEEMPAFYSGKSGIKSPSIVHSAEDVAKAYNIMRELGIQSGMLVAVPNNSTSDDNDYGEKVEQAIKLALKEVEDLALEGKDVTPYILKRVAEITDGDSLQSNIDLVKRNAEVGADIAIELAKRKKIEQNGKSQSIFIENPFSTQQKKGTNKGKVIVLGGAVIDLIAKPTDNQTLLPFTSNPGQCIESEGGVARNIAEVLGRLGAFPSFYTAVGNDARGKAILSHLEKECHVNISRGEGNNIQDTTISMIDGENTATYLAVLNEKGDLHTAIADMNVLSQIPTPKAMDWEGVKYLILDANPPLSTLICAAKAAVENQVSVFWEPTSIPKAIMAAKSPEFLSLLSYASPNVDELMAMANAADWSQPVHKDDDSKLKNAAKFILERMNNTGSSHLVVTRGEKGVLLASKHINQSYEYTFFDTKKETLKNCTGAGDTLSGAFVYSLINGLDEKEAVRVGMKAANMSIMCMERAISPLLNRSELFDQFKF